MAEIREMMKNLIVSPEKTDKKLKEVGIMLGNYGLVHGEIAEEEVYRHVTEALSRQEKTFDEVVRNMKKRGFSAKIFG